VRQLSLADAIARLALSSTFSVRCWTWYTASAASRSRGSSQLCQPWRPHPNPSAQRGV